MILAAFLRDDPYLFHNVASCRIEAPRVDSHGGIAFPVPVSYTQTVLGSHCRKQLKASAVLLEVMYLPPLLIHPHGHHMVMLPVDVRVPVNDIRLRPVPKTLHDVTDELLHLIIRQMFAWGRIHGHMKGEVLCPEVPSFIFPERLSNPLGFVYTVGMYQAGFAGGTLLLVVLQ